MLYLISGTDILRKRIEQHGGHTDFGGIKPMQNHNPNIRSKSFAFKRANSPSNQSSPGLPEKIPHNHQSNPMSALVTNTMDTALAGSSPHAVDGLNAYPDHERPVQQSHQSRLGNPNIRVTDTNNQQSRPPHAMDNPRDYRNRDYRDDRDYQDPQDPRDPRDHRNMQHGYQDNRRDYSRENHRDYLDNRRPDPRHNPPYQKGSDYDRGPYRYPGDEGGGRQERFSELLNSTTVTDHFDQYRTRRDDSGLGRDLDSPEERDRFPQQVRGAQTLQYTPNDRSPDSGLSDTDDSRSKTRPLTRRKTLPSIMKGVPPNAAAPVKPRTSPRHKSPGETVHSNENLTPQESDTYIIENGIRKRVKAEVYAQPQYTSSTYRPKASDEVPKDLPNRYKMESQTKLSRGANRGSLPDVTACRELQKTVMPREEVSKLSTQRREELRKLREEEEQRKQQEIVLRLTDLKVSHN